jgi:two-component system chemotaxis sensor kinase CheA
MTSPNSPRPVSLDDVATLLIQIEASDSAAIRHAHSILAAATATDPAQAGVLATITRQLKYALDFPSDAPTAMTFAHEIVAEAMEAADPSAPTRAGQTASSNAAEPGNAEHLPLDTDVDLLRDFIAESRDDLAGAEAALLTLEHEPGNTEAINRVFRAFHTVKGTSAFLGLTHITTFAHHAESLLSAVRERTIPFSRTCADLALRAADMLKALLYVAECATPGGILVEPEGYASLFETLEHFEAGHAQVMSPELQVQTQPQTPPVAAATIVSAAHVPAATVPTTITLPAHIEEALTVHQVRASDSGDSKAETSIRVRTDRLDQLIDLVGELVIAQAMLTQDDTVVRGGIEALTRKVAHAGTIVRELQDLSMSMRMVPLKATFRKMQRLSRDAAHRSGKDVELVIDGEDTEIDRNMVDVIGDPLVHMVRNAIDHGIETPDQRVARGKTPVGTLRLSAYHAGGNVIVELEDDGRGLDRERIAQKAIERGLIENDKGMSDADVYKLIFAPGFSTNDVVTDLSGRGVGMDVVKRNIESLQGRVEISSEPGRGTKFTVRLPLTLAITDGMCIRVGVEKYIIPTIHIRLSFRPTRDTLFSVAGKGEMVLLREDLMPVIRLHHLFDSQEATTDPTEALLVVVNAGDRQVALLVDELLGQQQVVAKPLGDGIGRICGVSGGAILGDGRVGLILDVEELSTVARQPSAGRYAA